MIIKSVLFDLDMTLVDTSCLLHLREKRRWKKVYAQIHKTTAYDGIKSIISRLADKFQLGIVTSSPGTYAKKVLQHHSLRIPVLSAYHDTKKHKPNPEPILNALMKLSCNPSDAIYIGDEGNDILASKSAGTLSGAVIWGLDNEATLVSLNPSVIFKSSENIIDYLK